MLIAVPCCAKEANMLSFRVNVRKIPPRLLLGMVRVPYLDAVGLEGAIRNFRKAAAEQKKEYSGILWNVLEGPYAALRRKGNERSLHKILNYSDNLDLVEFGYDITVWNWKVQSPEPHSRVRILFETANVPEEHMDVFVRTTVGDDRLLEEMILSLALWDAKFPIANSKSKIGTGPVGTFAAAILLCRSGIKS
jgi:hypothetical protein